MTLPVFVAVDGGGSKTLAAAVDEHGRTLATGRAGPSNVTILGIHSATAIVSQAIERMHHQLDAGQQPKLRRLLVGLAGVELPEQRRSLENWGRERYPDVEFTGCNDGELLLNLAGDEDRLALIAGTGSTCWAQDRNGVLARCGGLGSILGDHGSGYAIGIQALRLAALHVDGQASHPGLWSVIAQQWGISTTTELLQRVYAPPIPPDTIARIAPQVLDLAEQGDLDAQKLRERCVFALRRLAICGQGKLGLTRSSIVLSGGILTHQATLRTAVLEALGPRISSTYLVQEPAIAAARQLALTPSVSFITDAKS